MRPSSPSPTGISSRRPVRLTVSPSTILLPRAEQHGADVVGLEVEREAGHVVRQLEHLERHAVLEAVDARDAVGDRQDGADLGEVGLPASRPSMRLLRMEVISSGLICMSVRGSLEARAFGGCATCLRSDSRRSRMDASMTELPTRTTMPPRMSGSTLADSSTFWPVCSPMRSPMLLHGLLVELDRGGDLTGSSLFSFCHSSSKLAADAEQRPACGASRSAARGSSTRSARRP